MSFIDSIKSWLSGNKDTVNNAVDKGGEFLKNKAPQHEDKIDAARDKFDGVFNKESEPLSPHDGHDSKEAEDKSDSSEVKSEANPVVPEEESFVSEGVGEGSSAHDNTDSTAEISDISVDNLSESEYSTEGLVDEDAEDVSVGSGEETVETIPDFTDDDSPQRADIDPDSPAGFTELSEEQDLDYSPVVEPEPENEKLVEDAPIEVDDTKDSEGSSDVVSEDVDDSRAVPEDYDVSPRAVSDTSSDAVSGGSSDVVSEDYDVSPRAVSDTSSDAVSGGSSDVVSEDYDVSPRAVSETSSDAVSGGSSDVVSEDVDDSRAVSGGSSDVVSEDVDDSRAVSGGRSDVVSEDVDDSRAVSEGSSDVVSEDYDVSSRAVSEGSSDVDSEDVDSRAEDATLSTPLSTEDPLETSASRGESADSTESEIPAPEAPSESPVQVEEDVNSAIEEEDLIDPKNNALTGFVEDDNKAEGSVEGSDLVNTEVTGFSLKEPDEDFSLTDNTLKETLADKVEDSDSSKTLGDLLDEDNRE